METWLLKPTSLKTFTGESAQAWWQPIWRTCPECTVTSVCHVHRSFQPWIWNFKILQAWWRHVMWQLMYRTIHRWIIYVRKLIFCQASSKITLVPRSFQRWIWNFKILQAWWRHVMWQPMSRACSNSTVNFLCTKTNFLGGVLKNYFGFSLPQN